MHENARDIGIPATPLHEVDAHRPGVLGLCVFESSAGEPGTTNILFHLCDMFRPRVLQGIRLREQFDIGQVRHGRDGRAKCDPLRRVFLAIGA